MSVECNWRTHLVRLRVPSTFPGRNSRGAPQAGAQRAGLPLSESDLRMEEGPYLSTPSCLLPPPSSTLLGSSPLAPVAPGFLMWIKCHPGLGVCLLRGSGGWAGCSSCGAHPASRNESEGAEQMPALRSLLQVLRGAVLPSQGTPPIKLPHQWGPRLAQRLLVQGLPPGDAPTAPWHPLLARSGSCQLCLGPVSGATG